MISTRALAHIITQEVPTALTIQRERKGKREKGRQNHLELESKSRWTKGDNSLGQAQAHPLRQRATMKTPRTAVARCQWTVALPPSLSPPSLLRNVGEINLLPFGKNLHSTPASYSYAPFTPSWIHSLCVLLLLLLLINASAYTWYALVGLPSV